MDEFLVRHKIADEKTYKYFYRVIKNMIEIASEVEDTVKTQSYGVEIERHDIINNTLVKIEKNTVHNISPNFCKVNNIVKNLFEKAVSPLHLVDIIGTEADESVFDYH
ncbi:MAG: DUF6514 family protein [Clostridiaceae bacterium]